MAPKAKKARYEMNINQAVTQDFEEKSLADVSRSPVTALQGIGQQAAEALEKLQLRTVKDLADWKYYLIAKSISGLAPFEEKGGRPSDSLMNINKAIDKEHEVSSLADMVKLPPSALQGLAPWTDEVLASLHVRTIGDLGEWKFARWAESIVQLAEHENADFSHI
eukprot:TRINITY_DN32389_c0_g1_i1.p1 TRINITY_DN32389_c0_g1~~TRINITY_DN32389_c0_g1_i1.p1  ORF type:complete len:180 (+),score=44.76 TRINITY_DN32389_c0_g1_i1:48-542(+)